MQMCLSFIFVCLAILEVYSADLQKEEKEEMVSSENHQASIPALRYTTEIIGSPEISKRDMAHRRVRRSFGLRTICIPTKKKFCRKFTVKNITKRFCVSKNIYDCTALD